MSLFIAFIIMLGGMLAITYLAGIRFAAQRKALVAGVLTPAPRNNPI